MRWLLLLSCVGCGEPGEEAEELEEAREEAAEQAEIGPEGPAGLAGPTIEEIPTDAASIARGEAVFQARGCGGCHTFGSKLVGPDLAGVTQRRTIPWISKMIQHPDQMTKLDPTAKDLLRTHMSQMPAQGVTDDELPALLAYIRSQGG